MTALEEIKKAEHERIWLEPAGASDRFWCQDNQWGDEGVEYVLASTLESLQRDLAACQEQAVKDGNEISCLKDWQAGAVSCREAEQARIDEYRARAEEAVTAANALQVRADTAEAEVTRLQAEIDRKSSMPGDHRYWEGRYRDEVAENEKLKAGIKRLSDEEELLAETTGCDVMSLVSLAAKLAEAEQLARTYEGEANQLRDVSISNRIRAEEAEAGEKKLRETLQFYANPEIYKPHPHGPAFDRRDLSYSARTALASTGGEPHAE